MKITILEPNHGEEDEIIVKCRDISPEIVQLLNKLKTQSSLIAHIDNEIHKLHPMDIFYVEAVNNKTFLYGEARVYESKHKLYELEEMLQASGFLRVAKSLIINLSKLKSFAPVLSGRLEAVLANGERVTISRQYVGVLKERLGV
ncbi:MAG: LytTR family transcriptional regulator DNA-binding domain-containing protein [Defluviitaleaceae bacterium]|nr:LytTR family transcriptional regulator DNA-binding domain-containing protein [Defluviitaleaceae bacterium]